MRRRTCAAPTPGAAAGSARSATVESLAGDLRALGLAAGQVVLVHASMRRIGPVQGGASAVVDSIRRVVGGSGTLVTPAITADNSDSSRAHLARIRGMSGAQVARFRASMPPFDPATTPSTGMGSIAEHVRTAPGAVRSAHPQTSFAALGARAARIVSGHRPDCHFGERSPLARLYEMDARILLLGVGYDVCTAFHLAEYRYAADPPRRAYRCVITNGGSRLWWEYEDVVLDDADFGAIGRDWERAGAVSRGPVGLAASRLMPLAPAVDFASAWLRAHRVGAAVSSGV